MSGDNVDDDRDSDSEEEEALHDKEHDESDKERDHEVKQISCFTYTLQLVVNQAATFKDAIRCSHKLVSKVNTSTKVTEKLIGLCGKKLVLAVPTRWSSTFPVIEHLLLVKVSLGLVLKELGWDNLPMSAWGTLVSIKALLQLFAQLMSLVSSKDTIVSHPYHYRHKSYS